MKKSKLVCLLTFLAFTTQCSSLPAFGMNMQHHILRKNALTKDQVNNLEDLSVDVQQNDKENCLLNKSQNVVREEVIEERVPLDDVPRDPVDEENNIKSAAPFKVIKGQRTYSADDTLRDCYVPEEMARSVKSGMLLGRDVPEGDKWVIGGQKQIDQLKDGLRPREIDQNQSEMTGTIERDSRQSGVDRRKENVEEDNMVRRKRRVAERTGNDPNAPSEKAGDTEEKNKSNGLMAYWKWYAAGAVGVVTLGVGSYYASSDDTSADGWDVDVEDNEQVEYVLA